MLWLLLFFPSFLYVRRRSLLILHISVILRLLPIAKAAFTLPWLVPQPSPVDSYTIWPLQRIHQTLRQLQLDFPEFISVQTAQEAFGWQNERAGGDEDCWFDNDDDAGNNGGGCPNYFGIVQDYAAYPEGSEAASQLPTVLLSGALHGDERVGPTTVMETTLLLLQAAACQKYRQELQSHEDQNDCTDALREQAGLSNPQQIQWLARLVATRRIIVVPAANALGYFRNDRTEAGIDPNRDFPFDSTDSSSCMQTMAARTLNELFREHIVQMAVTFHAGIALIGYEWGAFPYLVQTTNLPTSHSPDHMAQQQLAAAFANFGASWVGEPEYPYDTINDLLYAVRGGMEDWAYGGYVP